MNEMLEILSIYPPSDHCSTLLSYFFKQQVENNRIIHRKCKLKTFKTDQASNDKGMYIIVDCCVKFSGYPHSINNLCSKFRGLLL